MGLKNWIANKNRRTPPIEGLSEDMIEDWKFYDKLGYITAHSFGILFFYTLSLIIIFSLLLLISILVPDYWLIKNNQELTYQIRIAQGMVIGASATASIKLGQLYMEFLSKMKEDLTAPIGIEVKPINKKNGVRGK